MSGSLLRILDANLNRAREALRVVEDYARFALDDDRLCADLKHLRHALADATRQTASEAILHRDTPGDVGTDNKTDAELSRAGVDDVVTAAGKRLGEALRTIEECLKTIDPPAAARVERCRYDFYELERRIALTLRPAGLFAGVRLYVLVTESLCAGRDWLAVAEAAITGGADCLQLREKGLESGELLARARKLVELCRARGVISIINDRPDIAVLSGADGVHVGQTDLPASEARKIVGRRRIVGVSTHSLPQAKQAVLDGADYIGVGPVFPSSTKPRPILPGPDYARSAAAAVPIPCIAIAGITAENAASVMATGVSGVAASNAVIGVADVRAAAERLRRAAGGPSVRGAATASVGQTFLSVSDFQSEPVVHKRWRHLPHWTMRGAVYFLTFRSARGQLSMPERLRVLEHVVSGHGRFYALAAAVIMHDHVHLLLRPTRPYELPQVVKGIKGVAGRLVNQMRNSTGNLWQDESFDRIVRDEDELRQTAEYMYNNPLKAGLCTDPEEYPAKYFDLRAV